MLWLAALCTAASLLTAALAWLFWWSRLQRLYTLTLPLDVAARATAISYPRYAVSGPVLVTGGAGFLGRSLVDALIAQGLSVAVLDATRGYAPPKGATLIPGGLGDKAALLAALREHRIRLVFHAASPDPRSTDAALLHAVNVVGTQNLLAACREAGVREFIYTSSASVVWAGAAQEGVDESAPYPAAFLDLYAQTKAAAEAAVMAAGSRSDASAAASGGRGELVTISLRPHALFGPSDSVLVPTLVATAKSGWHRWIVGDGSNLADWTYVGNAVHGHLRAAEVAQREGAAPCAASGRAFFLTDSAPVPFWLFVNRLLLGLGYEPSSARLPLGLLLAFAYAAQAASALVGATCRRGAALPPGPLSPARLLLAAVPHSYSCAAAARELGYAPLWDADASLFLTLRAFAHLRNLRPAAAALENARRGNLVALGLVKDAAAATATAAAPPAAGVMRGANDAPIDEAALPLYTAAQVAGHASAEDAWVIIKGLVYDLTRYVSDHPGGAVILRNVGGDATEGFFGTQHPEHVYGTVRKFLIGRLAPPPATI